MKFELLIFIEEKNRHFCPRHGHGFGKEIIEQLNSSPDFTLKNYENIDKARIESGRKITFIAVHHAHQCKCWFLQCILIVWWLSWASVSQPVWFLSFALGSWMREIIAKVLLHRRAREARLSPLQSFETGVWSGLVIEMQQPQSL